jgi:hypothetical protein
MNRQYLIGIVFFFVSAGAFPQGIEGIYQVIVKKQQEKQGQRWTLLDWLGTKKKMALMDQWLALNSSSSSLFEFSLEASKGDLDFGDALSVSEKSFERFSSSLYIKFLGLSIIKEKIGTELSSTSFQGSIILLGSSNQSTNIQAYYGVRNLTYLNQELSPNYWGARANLYILPFLGGFYDYRKYLSDSEGQYSFNSGDRHEFGGFLELWLLRLKVTLMRERLDFSGLGIAGRPSWNGGLVGAELFF